MSAAGKGRAQNAMTPPCGRKVDVGLVFGYGRLSGSLSSDCRTDKAEIPVCSPLYPDLLGMIKNQLFCFHAFNCI